MAGHSPEATVTAAGELGAHPFGSVDESLIVVGSDGEGMSRPGNVGEPVDVTVTSRVAEFNDLECLERQLVHGDVAAVLVEPALTNIGIVLPEPGYLEGVRELARRSPPRRTSTFTTAFSGPRSGSFWAADYYPAGPRTRRRRP
jgi:glutamate-1-semialdehyde 2,1-aminomutase